LILHGYFVCAIDPKGDYSSLEALQGVTVLGREDAPPPRELLRALRYPDRSVVIDLSRLPHDEKLDYVRAALPALSVLRRRTDFRIASCSTKRITTCTIPMYRNCSTSSETATRSSPTAHRGCRKRCSPAPR
jgi:hypothetical protein